MGMVLWESKVIYGKSESRRNGGGERACCSGEEEENTEEETGIGWDTPAGASLIKLLMEHQFPEQDSPWLGNNESEEESGGSTKMMENSSSSMDWLDLMVGEAAEEAGGRSHNLVAVAQDMNVIVQQRQNDNIFLQHAAACMAMAPSTPTPEPTQSASLAFSKLLGLQDLPSSSHHINPWPSSSSLHLKNTSSGPTQFIDSKNLHFQFHSPLYDFRSHPPSPFLHHSSQFKPSSPLIKMQQSALDSREAGRKRARITPSVSSIAGIRRSSNSDPSKPKRNGSRNPACHALNTNLKPRAKQGCANDPQSIAARQRRERISERLKILQDLIPNGSKVDLVTMLEKAINYVKFLQLQVKVLMNDEFWATQQEQENPDHPSSDITSSHEYNGSM